MKPANRSGFTLIEVIIALVVLSVGILGLVTTAALVTRMIGRGARATEAALLAQERIEVLRSTPCAALTSGDTTTGPYTRKWVVVAAGDVRRVQLIVYYPAAPGQLRADTFATAISCAPGS